MRELISVIVPVFNAADYLPDCLKSITGQTYRDLEIILVDDGSRDSSGRICDEYAASDDRIVVIHKKNGGVSSARNAGLSRASGTCIGFVDADDFAEPDMFRRLHEAIEDADLAACGFVEYPLGNTDVSKINGKRQAVTTETVMTAGLLYQRDGYATSLWNKLFRKKICCKNGKPIPFREDLYFGEDEVWLAEVLQNCGKAVFIPVPLYHWMPRAESATRTERLSEKQLSVIKAKHLAMKFLPGDRSVQRLARARMFNDCYFLKAQAYYTGDQKKYRKICKALAPLKKNWLLSGDPGIFRKIKVMVMEMEMTLLLPESIIKKTDSMRRNGIRRS